MPGVELVESFEGMRMASCSNCGKTLPGWKVVLSTPLFPLGCLHCGTEQHRVDARWPLLLAWSLFAILVVVAYGWVLFRWGELPSLVLLATAVIGCVLYEVRVWGRIRMQATGRREKHLLRLGYAAFLFVSGSLFAWLVLGWAT